MYLPVIIYTAINMPLRNHALTILQTPGINIHLLLVNLSTKFVGTLSTIL